MLTSLFSLKGIAFFVFFLSLFWLLCFCVFIFACSFAVVVAFVCVCVRACVRACMYACARERLLGSIVCQLVAKHTTYRI